MEELEPKIASFSVDVNRERGVVWWHKAGRKAEGPEIQEKIWWRCFFIGSKWKGVFSLCISSEWFTLSSLHQFYVEFILRFSIYMYCKYINNIFIKYWKLKGGISLQSACSEVQNPESGG